jgi:hypothetical protein
LTFRDFESLDRKTISALLKLIQVFKGYFREKSFKVSTKSSWRGLRAKVEGRLIRKYLKVAPEKGSCSCNLSRFTSG